MKLDNLKEAINDRYADLAPSPSMLENIRLRTSDGNASVPSRPAHRTLRRWPAAIAAALALILTLSIPVFALNPGWYDSIISYFLSETIPLLEPLDTVASADCEGFHIEVLSAVADDYSLLMEVEITDTEGERIIEQTEHWLGGPAGTYLSVPTVIERSPTHYKAYWYSIVKFPITHDSVDVQIDFWKELENPTPQEIEEGVMQIVPCTVSFPVERVQSTNLEMATADGTQLENIVLSPFTLRWESDTPTDLDNVHVEMKSTDGQTYTFDVPQANDLHSLSETDIDNGGSSVFLLFGKLIEVDSIQSVSINGAEVTFMGN